MTELIETMIGLTRSQQDEFIDLSNRLARAHQMQKDIEAEHMLSIPEAAEKLKAGMITIEEVDNESI